MLYIVTDVYSKISCNGTYSKELKELTGSGCIRLAESVPAIQEPPVPLHPSDPNSFVVDMPEKGLEYDKETDVCNFNTQKAITEDKTYFNHSGARQLSELAHDFVNGSPEDLTGEKLLCNSLYYGASFEFDSKYIFGTVRGPDDRYKIISDNVGLVSFGFYGYLEDEYTDVVEDKEKGKSRGIEYDFKSDIFLLGDYGKGYYRQYHYYDYAYAGT